MLSDWMVRITLLPFVEPAMSEPKDLETPPLVNAKSVADEAAPPLPIVEIGGRGGLDPTRYGDWEKNGRCIDF